MSTEVVVARSRGRLTGLGNHVVEDLGGGRFALFAHLDTGSVRVHRGQRIRAGQMLGRVGNTGASALRTCTFTSATGRSPSRPMGSHTSSAASA